ncbi:MAG: hypothetical protein R3E31_15885 [Chloroflexota bacterium]
MPGDVVLLEAGNLVPADRSNFVESVNLKVQEAALTGESEPAGQKCGSHSTQRLGCG